VAFPLRFRLLPRLRAAKAPLFGLILDQVLPFSENSAISCSKLCLCGLFVDCLIEDDPAGNPNASNHELVIEKNQIGSFT
jgi:hypothetical protein